MKNPFSVALAAAYLATIPVANWMIANVGTQAFPGGPHTISVGFGYVAPSGVLMIGLAMFLRDLVQARLGKYMTSLCIVAGIVLSYFVNETLATASAVAFAVSEFADFAIYTRLRERTMVGAVVASGVVGSIIDSLLFLQLAFGSTAFWQGQIIGKTWMTLLGAALIWGANAVSHRLSASQATFTTTAS